MISKLRVMKSDVSDDILVVMILNSLPPKFGYFLVNYNCQKEKLTVNELISHCFSRGEKVKK
jgi:gag-polypeptide of LTR copia-type